MEQVQATHIKRIRELLLLARASCGVDLQPTDFSDDEFEAALSEGELRVALDLVDAIADENPTPVVFFESLLEASQLLEILGETRLEGNIQYYMQMLELLQSRTEKSHT